MDDYVGFFSSSSDDEISEYVSITAQMLLDDQAESSNVERNTRRYISRDRLGAGERLMQDYFSTSPTYTPEMFRRRFRMRRELFMRLVEGITTYYQEPLPEHFLYFAQRPDARGVLGFSAIQTLMLEAVASYDLWIWHAFFGVAGSNNDINVLNQSPLFRDILNDTAPEAPFEVNGATYNKGYYLTDGIYPEWAMFVKSFSRPADEKRKKFKKAQESARKDIERAFGVLQARFAIVKNPARPTSINKLRRIMYTCIILHNMIIEDQGYAISPVDDELEIPAPRRRTQTERCAAQLRNYRELRDREMHHNLRGDLMEHIWQLPANFRA